ncbi:PH-domain-containing protein [Marasmius fiardii PR-910]|nr:PH-domain-containing protein [Marasmius fiardii PR-910]
MSPSAAPPSPQEIQRKLSTHSVHRSVKPPPVAVPPVSGTESDSDSILTPDAWTMSPSGFTGPSQHGLSSIAERRSGSGEDTEDEDDEGEGGWKMAEDNDQGRASLDESVIKTGYLWKKGERRKTWKKRWFVLRPGHLAYYKTAAEYQLLRLLDLSDVHSCTKVTLKRHENAFGLVSPVRTFYLQAKTPEEVQAWVQAIEDARQALASQSSGTAPIPIPRAERSNSLAPTMTPSPPSQLQCVTSSDSEDASPTSHQTIPPVHQTPSAVSSSPSKALPAAQKGLGKAILSGYLMKCGSKRRHWHKRWFVLTVEKLMYSASHMDTKPHRQFPYSDILDALEYDVPSHRNHAAPVSSPPVESDSPVKAHTFKIVTTKKTLLVCAPSEEDEITWLGAIRALIARRAAGPGGHNDPPKTASDVSPNSSGFTSSGGTSGLKAKVRRLSASAASGAAAAVSRGEESAGAPKQS